MIPKDLKDRCEKVFASFVKIADDWKKYEDEIIPQDDTFAKEILDALLDLISEAKGLDEKVVEYLATFWYKFGYGPQGDDYNYLSFDEGNIVEPFLEIDWDAVKKEDLDALEKEIIDIRAKFK